MTYNVFSDGTSNPTQSINQPGPNYSTGIVSRCIGPTTSKGHTKDGCKIFTHRRSVAERAGYFQPQRLFVCPFVSLSVCLFVRTITSERLNLG